jgi:hypothetical protein
MARRSKRLEQMQRNPRGDWRIDDVRAVCREFGISCDAPSGGGSHYTVATPADPMILTIPARRPIKPVYIRLLATYIRRIEGVTDGKT